MRASSFASRIKRCVTVRDWPWWQLPLLMRLYVAVPPVTALAVIGIAAAHTDWRVSDAVSFLILMCCGIVSVASTPRIAYANPGVTRDFTSVWVLPTAILLPPIYAALIPIPFYLTLHLFVHPGKIYRRVFTAASLSLSYVTVSLLFQWFPVSFAGGTIGAGVHAFTWVIAVAACEVFGNRAQHFFIAFAVKLADPTTRILEMEWDREAMQGLFVEIDLAALITLAVGLSPTLVVIALPTVLLVRRFLVHPILVAQSRIDSKTGLLNVSTWETEAEAELSRAIRTRYPLALALIDIDHFKTVNDTYGHLVGDRVLKSLAEALTGQSRDYDRVGRFGGEEFVLLLAQTGEKDACKIAQRLRGYISGLEIPVDDRSDAPTLKVTISVGVTAMARGESYELTDLLAAADSAMYAAKEAGRNRVAFAPPLHDMGIDTAWNGAASEGGAPASAAGASSGERQDAVLPAGGTALSSHRAVLVQMDQPAVSLCLSTLLSVFASALFAYAIASQCGPRTCRPPGRPQSTLRHQVLTSCAWAAAGAPPGSPNG
jgi:diguanylate cyclase (GGDEF)-like protein